MMLLEADAKQLVADRGLAVPPGRRLLRADDAFAAPASAVAVKAQVQAGGRGKAGLIRLAAPADATDAVAAVRAAMAERGHPPLVMVEDQIAIAAEHYLAWRIDDVRQGYALMYSPHGGVEIEDHAYSLSELFCPALAPIRLAAVAAFLAEAGLTGRVLAAVARFAVDLHAVLVREDATLVEINPLAITDTGAAVALDAKIVLDENAAPRHADHRRLASFAMQGETGDPIEREAVAAGITFVRLPGEVALVTGGAGIGMTLVDLLGDAGYAAANFVDVPGGSGARVFGDLTRLVLRRAAEPGVRAVLIFLTLSATSLKQPVESILAALDAGGPAVPIVVGLVAGGSAEREMTLAEAQAAFRARGHECVGDLDAAVAAVVAAIEA